MAPHRAQTPPLPMPLIAPRQDEFFVVVISPALAPCVDQGTVGKLGTPTGISGRQLVFGDEIDNRRDEIDNVVRTTGQIHQVLQARHGVFHAGGTGWVRLRAGQPTIRRACADGKRCLGFTRYLFEDVERALAAHGAVDPIRRCRNRTFHNADILSGVIPDDIIARFCSIRAGGDHQCLMVLDRKNVKQQ